MRARPLPRMPSAFLADGNTTKASQQPNAQSEFQKWRVPFGDGHEGRPGWPAVLLAVHRKRQQYVARHASEARVTGIDVEHAIHNHGAGAVKRAAACGNSIYG